MRKLKLMLGGEFANYRLNMAGITQNKQKCFIFIVNPQGRKRFNQIRLNEGKMNVKK